jgi:hypothetical protein
MALLSILHLQEKPHQKIAYQVCSSRLTILPTERWIHIFNLLPWIPGELKFLPLHMVPDPPRMKSGESLQSNTTR